jgi:hypothetical protein
MRLSRLTEKVLAWRCRRYRKLIWPYVDGVLEPEQRMLLNAHLPQCIHCRTEYEELRFAREQVSRLRLPDDVPIKFPAWLQEQPVAVPEPSEWAWPRWALATAVVALLAFAGLLTWYLSRSVGRSAGGSAEAGWEVVRLAGAPVVATQAITKNGRLKVGDSLETNGSSRALLRVGNIGQVEVEPGSRLRLLAARANEHRLALVKGRMHASITAPPRLFFIETPAVEAIDYGCAYTLEVDESGASRLQVTAGWVSLKALGQTDGREVLVPAGALCYAQPSKGPGTPFFEDAAKEFRRALDQLDFAEGGSQALATILAEARLRDSLTLFHLLPRLAGAERERVYDRLAAFVPPPAGLTRDNLLQPNNAERLDKWREHVEFVSLGGNPADLPKRTGTLRPTGFLNTARYAHTATALPDGRVLIAGGMERDRTPVGTAEIYDPATGQFTVIGRLTTNRIGHTATLLRDGRVLLVGGSGGSFYLGALANAEIYDPASGTFKVVAKMATARLAHRATLLPDGKVLIIGGLNNDDEKLTSAELYDPVTQSFTIASAMQTPRADHTTTLLKDGRVLVVGGGTTRLRGETPVASAEIYDPAQRAFLPTGEMSVPRYKHAATLLPDGRVIVIGGTGPRLWADRKASSEIYDPATGQFTLTGSLNLARYKIRDAVLLLPNGKILVAGGGARVELFDPVTGVFSTVSGGVGAARHYATATLLPNGEVLIVGGYINGLPALTADVSAWVYQPSR